MASTSLSELKSQLTKEYNRDYAILGDRRGDVAACKNVGDGFFLATFAAVAVMGFIYVICWIGWVEGGTLPYWFGRVSTGWLLPLTLSVLGGILHWAGNRLDRWCKAESLKLKKGLDRIQEME